MFGGKKIKTQRGLGMSVDLLAVLLKYGLYALVTMVCLYLNLLTLNPGAA
jgi:hypothetical protein